MATHDSVATSDTHSIAIIGAGPGGLTLARILQQANIPVVVYEFEASRTARTQGGTLDLHAESGQLAVKEAGLWPQIEKLLRYEGEDFRMMDNKGFLHVEVGTELGRNRPEIDRLQLREILLDSLDSELIFWDSKVKKVEQRSDGKYNIHFEGKVAEGFDLVIGADGAWSKVRPLLSETMPYYSGISAVELVFTDVDIKQPKVSKLVGRGSMFALGDNQNILVQRNGDGSVKVYAAIRSSENFLKESGIDFSDPEDARKGLLKIFDNWDLSLQELLTLCDDLFIPRPMYMLPPGFTWPNRPGVTLIGDAAHLMTPFAGEGVNQAMLDALRLGQQIIANTNDLTTAVVNYEQEIFKRTAKKAHLTASRIDVRFSENASKAFMEQVAARHLKK